MDYQIPNGPHDAPFLFLLPEQERMAFDPADKLGSMYMLNHDFKGCMILPFSKEVMPESGKVLLDGQPVPFVVKEIRIMDNVKMHMLGVRLAGLLVDHGMEATLSVSGFTDLNGNTMAPVTLTVFTEEQTQPLPQYAAHEAVALHAAEEGIVLLKNEHGALPMKHPCLNVVGEGLYGFLTCAVGAGKINPRYQIDFRQAVMADSEYSLNEELADFFRQQPMGVPDEDILRRAAEKERYRRYDPGACLWGEHGQQHGSRRIPSCGS